MKICKHVAKIRLLLMCIKPYYSSCYKGAPEALRLALWSNQSLTEGSAVDNLQGLEQVCRVDHNLFQLLEHFSLHHLLDCLKSSRIQLFYTLLLNGT